MKNENKNATGEATYRGALRAPLAGSPTCVFGFVFVLIYVEFELRKNRLELGLGLGLGLRLGPGPGPRPGPGPGRRGNFRFWGVFMTSQSR